MHRPRMLSRARRKKGQRIPATPQLPRPTRPAAATGSGAPISVSLDYASVVGGLRGAALNVANFHRSPHLLPRFPVKVVILRALPACSPQNCALTPWVAVAAQILCRVVDFSMRNEPARALRAMPPDLAFGVLALGLHRLFTRAHVACDIAAHIRAFWASVAGHMGWAHICPRSDDALPVG
jgi:hypothetical protein